MSAATVLGTLGIGFLVFGLILAWLNAGLTGAILGATGIAGGVASLADGLLVMGVLFLILAVGTAVLGSE